MRWCVLALLGGVLPTSMHLAPGRWCGVPVRGKTSLRLVGTPNDYPAPSSTFVLREALAQQALALAS